MTLTPGIRLGPYEILSPLGAGGMGEVYRARDPRLNRDVAVKVLPEEFFESEERRGRFEREAKLLAALNHSNIATIHSFEEIPSSSPASPPRHILVMELLEGETLREALMRGPLPRRKALEVAAQMADALAAAHAKEIVHRDVKPENVFLTRDGRAKLLDFGIARHRPPAAPADTVTPTITAVSEPGVLVGTVSYMSPEQARGAAVDFRSDQFSLGVVLYEMLTGKRPFGGATPTDTLAAILRDDPEPLEKLDPATPVQVQWIVDRCLAKEARERYDSTRDLARELENCRTRPGESAHGAFATQEKSPYPGLASFTEEDAGRFFGREDEVKTLWRKLRERTLLAVIGPSGAGKTSFVRAGVVAGRPEGWAAIVATPGNAPLRAFARALGPQLASDPEALRRLADFEDGETAFELLSRWRRSHDDALVVVDQFEELFTLNPPETQARFASFLGRLAREGDIHVLLSLRDDFMMRCSEHAVLASVFEALTPLPPITRDGLRRALVEPAARRAYRFEDEALVDEMIGAVEGARGALPLLAFAVSRLWDRRYPEEKLLTRQAHVEIGGVAGALAQHAEETMDRIGAAMEPTVRELFRNLTTAQGTRAVLDREELLTALPDRSAAETVLGKLIDARLLTSWETEATEGQPARHRVEIVHESLLSAWPRLVRWQTQDADGAQLRDQLRQAAHLWEERGKAEDLLWTGSSYLDYRVWRGRYPGKLSSLEEEFSASMQARADRAKRRRRTAYAVVLAAVALTAAGLGTMWQRSARETRRAEAEAGRAEAGKLLAFGRLRLADHPNAAVAYAIASLERADNDPARRFAVEALWQGPIALYLPDPVTPASIQWTRDGRWLALGGSRGVALLERDTGERRQLHSLFETPIGFSSDGTRLVTKRGSGGRGAEAHIWALPEGRLERTLEHKAKSWDVLVDDRLVTFAFDTPPPEGKSPATVRRLSLDGKTEEVLGRWEPQGLTYADVDPTGTWLFSVQRGRILQQRLDALSAPGRLLGTHEGEANIEAQSWLGRAVTGDSRGEVRFWDVPSARLERTLKSPADARFIALDPKGRFLATGPPGGVTPRSLILFDLDAPRSAEPMPLLNSEVSYLNNMGFSPEGSWLATMSFGSPGTLWNVASRRSTVLGREKPPYLTVAFTPDGRLVSTSDAGVVRLWSLSPAADDGVRELWSRAGARLGCNLVMDARGRFVVASKRFAGEVLVLPLDGSPPSVHVLKRGPGASATANFGGVDPEGRYLAVSSDDLANPAERSIRLLDLATGAERRLDTHARGEAPCEKPGSMNEGTATPLWLPDGRLVSDGDAGLLVWDLDTGTSQQLRPCRNLASGGSILLATPDSRTILRLDPAAGTGDRSTLTAFDLSTRATREIPSHGNRVESFAVDARGLILVTGSMDGVVRVGPLTGEEPHLHFGHTGPVSSVAVSPDGRTIASASEDGTIRLWPMPDLSKPPLHTLPHDELVAKLKSLTNLRAVRDPASDTGWKIDVGPFPGWKDVPTWQP